MEVRSNSSGVVGAIVIGALATVVIVLLALVLTPATVDPHDPLPGPRGPNVEFVRGTLIYDPAHVVVPDDEDVKDATCEDFPELPYCQPIEP